ncbi:unnamed protein product [Lactuca virosa]|uniref:Glucan endo-1,3-beta-D-glucosidase n=1 Tax=Lactuca virosa TaxID=75947 RepID=A0AAU9MF76_9ASTR|nr:unnamed protein product [Lactuca virosa]
MNNIQNYSDVRFRYVAVGNDVNPNKGNSEYVSSLLPAMRNLHSAVTAAGLGNQIKVLTAIYGGLLGVSFLPSDGAFNDNAREFIEPIIRFLAENNSPMLVNIYTYFAYANANGNSNLPYALFTASGTIVKYNGRQYFNLFDIILDDIYAALASLGGENVEIVVSESGWPSAGDDAATTRNA